MGLIWLASAARRRSRRVRADEDAGFMLIYVLAITTVIAILVGGTLVVTTNAIVPSVQSAYDQAADAAAQSGLQSFIAYVDANCPNATSVSGCAANLTQASGTVDVPIPGSADGYSATYSWVATPDPNNRYFRVKSIGKVSQGGVSAKKVVVGDVVGGASVDDLDYGVITGFESQSSSTVLSQWPARTIALDAAAIDAADVPVKGNTITWSGASPGSAAGKVAVCNATFDEKGGRANLPAPKAPNPYVDWTESGLAGNNYTNFQPCQTSWGSKTELLAAANPNDGTGGYFSNDAMLLSNSYPGGSGPLFNQPVSTTWQYTSADAGVCSTAPGQNYRSFNLLCAGYPVEVGGAPAAASTYPTVTAVPQGPQLSTTAPIIPADACVYAGPTRVLLNGDTAVVTSPQTTLSWIATNAASRPAQCYPGATATGMAVQTVNLASPTPIQVLSVNNNGTVPKTTPAIAHGSSGWPTTGQRLGTAASSSDSVFNLSTGSNGSSTPTTANTVSGAPGTYTPAKGDNPSSKSDGAWSPQWTSDSNSGCSSAAPSDLAFANCFIPKGSYSDSYSWLKASVQQAVAANPSNYTTSAQLQALVNSLTSQGNSSDAANAAPANADNGSHRWTVSMSSGSAGGCTTASGVPGTATDTGVAAPTSDPFFANTAGNVHVAQSTATACYTATVSAQMGTCNVALVLGLCVNLGNYVWGNGTALLGGGKSVAQFSVTFTVNKTTTTTTSTAATSTFPSMADVTQYQLGNNGTFGASGPGDLYVQGNVGHTMALVAANDLIVTGSTGPTGTIPANPSTTNPNPDTVSTTPTTALELIGQNNVRVYHPVSCKVTDTSMIATTDPGWCPDDITGLYSSVLPSASRPDQQYVNMRPDLVGLTIHAAVFALGNDDAHINCPQPPSGDGICGGEFSVDNYNRGSSLGYLTEIGTLAMAHHSPVGEEWEVADSSGQSSRPYSGYQLAQQYENIKAAINAAPGVKGTQHTTSTSSSLWHIMSISSGGGS